VTGATTGVANLNTALAMLEQMGEPSALILDRLGSDVEGFYNVLTEAGLPIPDMIHKFHYLAAAQQTVVDTTNQVTAAINTQVGGTFSQVTPDSAEQIRMFMEALAASGPQQPIVMTMDGRTVATMLAPHNLSLARNQSVRITGTR